MAFLSYMRSSCARLPLHVHLTSRTLATCPKPHSAEYEVGIIGGGVVGAAVCRELALRGIRVAMFERGAIGGGVSAGNTGIACTMLGVTQGTLEHRCLQRGVALNAVVHEALNIPRRACGTLYVAWDDSELALLEPLLGEAVAADSAGGNAAPRLLSGAELRKEEPGIGINARGALLVPGETVVDPGLVPLAYANDAVHHGAHVFEDTNVISADRCDHDGNWKLRLQKHGDVSECSEDHVRVQHVVNCGGLGADDIQVLGKQQVDDGELCFRPRRGDYIVFFNPMAGKLDPALPLTRPVGTVPTPLARGVYVWATVHGHMVCGPTNVEQSLKELPSAKQSTLESLRAKALATCPELHNWQVVANYAGLRPALDPAMWGTDYLIRTRADASWTVVAGVRSTGLTASLGIAATLADEFIPAPKVLRNNACSDKPASSPALHTSPQLPTSAKLPSIQELRQSFAKRKDGCVEILGRAWRIGHPQTCLGLAGPEAVSWVSRVGSDAAQVGSRLWHL